MFKNMRVSPRVLRAQLQREKESKDQTDQSSPKELGQKPTQARLQAVRAKVLATARGRQGSTIF